MKIWIPCSTEEDPKYLLLNVASRFAQSGELEPCPLCGEDSLRFYYHEFPVEEKPRNRGGTLWIWCNSCLKWAHISGIRVFECEKLKRLSNDKVVLEEKRHNLIEHLNSQWEAGNIGRYRK